MIALIYQRQTWICDMNLQLEFAVWKIKFAKDGEGVQAGRLEFATWICDMNTKNWFAKNAP